MASFCNGISRISPPSIGLTITVSENVIRVPFLPFKRSRLLSRHRFSSFALRMQCSTGRCLTLGHSKRGFLYGVEWRFRWSSLVSQILSTVAIQILGVSSRRFDLRTCDSHETDGGQGSKLTTKLSAVGGVGGVSVPTALPPGTPLSPSALSQRSYKSTLCFSTYSFHGI